MPTGDPNQLAALWLCYTTNSFYRDKLQRDIAVIRNDTNFQTVTGLQPDQIDLVHSRIFNNADIQQKLAAVRDAFQTVFQPGQAGGLWGADSPTTTLIRRLATGAGPSAAMKAAPKKNAPAAKKQAKTAYGKVGSKKK